MKKKSIFELQVTKIFLLPTLEIPGKALTENDFIESYSYESNEEKQYENSIYLVFKPRDLAKFEEFLNGENDRTHLLIDDYDYDEFVVVVYKLPAKWNKDYDLIRQGKYSKVSDAFKELFPKKIKNTEGEVDSLQYRIFYKTEDLRKFWQDYVNLVQLESGQWRKANELTKEEEEQIVKNSQASIYFDKSMELWPTWSIEKETLKRELLYG